MGSLDSGYSLQVGFAQVPEPAAAVALVGVLALVYAGMKSKKAQIALKKSQFGIIKNLRFLWGGGFCRCLQ